MKDLGELAGAAIGMGAVILVAVFAIVLPVIVGFRAAVAVADLILR